MLAIKLSAKVKRGILLSAVAFLAVGYFSISTAYAMLLEIPKPTEELKTSTNGTLPVNTAGTITGFGRSVVQPRLDTLVGEIVRDARANPTGLLWAMYPASIRGRVFSGNVESSNPLSTGGW